ncbi:MAG: UDP-N-acetylmuramoyl-tripeptide--D-alanyl-D-alanine ligase [Treponema sp.]|jgi:UDP-N-acetylmuramoyl-tripeptide--D-alanyl-D-alanine ligase|nr:UDP-N-acetylmuramoyl-tripeptide--D-alanyl-D-alanine ligase [Treponema sp.]
MVTKTDHPDQAQLLNNEQALPLMGVDELSRSLCARHVSFSQGGNGFYSVSVDSRKVKEGSLFFALSGSISDGHKYVDAAFGAGATAAVVESSKTECFNLVSLAQKMEKDLIIVENTLKSLQDSARIYLEKFPSLLKIGITGSSGKTTTKEIAAAIISCEKNVIKNEGNLNSDTGLPLSVFQVRACHEVGIFELGMNRKNEILEIAEVLKPNIALVTNIGSAHIEFFGSREKIVNEKKCIFKFLNNNGIALVPANDKYADELSQGIGANVKFYGVNNFKEFEGSRSLGLEGTEIIWAGEKIKFNLPGKHNLDDAIAAVAIAKEIPVNNKSIKKGLESVRSLFGRLEILHGRTTVIRDCYNASPESTAKSIEFCDSLEWPKRKIYIIADMLELGEESINEHKKLASILSVSEAEMIFLFGNETTETALYLADKKRSFFHSRDIEELSAAVNNYVLHGDLVLLKGSRGCALERLSDMLTGDKTAEVRNVL